jgi:hypothetical protein
MRDASQPSVRSDCRPEPCVAEKGAERWRRVQWMGAATGRLSDRCAGSGGREARRAAAAVPSIFRYVARRLHPRLYRCARRLHPRPLKPTARASSNGARYRRCVAWAAPAAAVACAQWLRRCGRVSPKTVSAHAGFNGCCGRRRAISLWLTCIRTHASLLLLSSAVE